MAENLHPSQPGRGHAAWWLAIAPAAFLAHFSAVYGFTALACAFGWTTRSLLGLPLLSAVIVLLTLLAGAAVLLAMPRRAARAGDSQGHDDDDDDRDEGRPSYADSPARRHFVIGTGRMLAVLAVVGMVVVALPALLTEGCP